MSEIQTRAQQSDSEEVMRVYKKCDGDEVTSEVPKLHVGEGRKYRYQIRFSGQSGLA